MDRCLTMIVAQSLWAVVGQMISTSFLTLTVRSLYCTQSCVCCEIRPLRVFLPSSCSTSNPFRTSMPMPVDVKGPDALTVRRIATYLRACSLTRFNFRNVRGPYLRATIVEAARTPSVQCDPPDFSRRTCAHHRSAKGISSWRI